MIRIKNQLATSAQSDPPRVLERRQRVQSAETAMAVLKGLAAIGGNASLTVLSAHVGENPAKVHRYLVSLMHEGLVDQDSVSQRYLLGSELIQIGLAAMRQADPIRRAEPALIRLRERFDVTCFVAVMGNKGPTVMRIEEPGLPVTVNVRPGSVMSLLWSATGRVFLGLLNESRLRLMAEEELASATPYRRGLLPPADPIASLQKEIQRLRCAVVRGTYLPGISAVAVPVYDFNGRVCAVMTALGASGGFDPSIDGEIGIAVRHEAAATSWLLGYSATASIPPP